MKKKFILPDQAPSVDSAPLSVCIAKSGTVVYMASRVYIKTTGRTVMVSKTFRWSKISADRMFLIIAPIVFVYELFHTLRKRRLILAAKCTGSWLATSSQPYGIVCYTQTQLRLR